MAFWTTGPSRSSVTPPFFLADWAHYNTCHTKNAKGVTINRIEPSCQLHTTAKDILDCLNWCSSSGKPDNHFLNTSDCYPLLNVSTDSCPGMKHRCMLYDVWSYASALCVCVCVCVSDWRGNSEWRVISGEPHRAVGRSQAIERRLPLLSVSAQFLQGEDWQTGSTVMLSSTTVQSASPPYILSIYKLGLDPIPRPQRARASKNGWFKNTQAKKPSCNKNVSG